MLKTKSVRSPTARTDGLRVLVARFRGRGLPSARYHVWMASLGPSERLLRQLQCGTLSWRAFQRAYRAELFAPAAIDGGNRTIKNHGQKFSLRLLKHLARVGNLTLLCHCGEDETRCHRHVLKKIIERV